MSTSPLTTTERQVVVHQFIRLFGRRPTDADLSHYLRAGQQIRARVPGRVRRRVAMVITRL